MLHEVVLRWGQDLDAMLLAALDKISGAMLEMSLQLKKKHPMVTEVHTAIASCTDHDEKAGMYCTHQHMICLLLTMSFFAVGLQKNAVLSDIAAIPVER